MRIIDAAVQRERQRNDDASDAKELRMAKWIVYKFYDEYGRVIFEKVRRPLDAPPPRDKTFFYRHTVEGFTDGGMERANLKPSYADDYLYHLTDLLRAKASGADVWWTEGEKDADKLEEFLDAPDCTVSHHGGAGKISPEQVGWFRDHTGYVGLLMDLDADDEHGANPGAYDVIRRYDLLRAVGLPRERLRVFAPAVGKDVYDHLTAGKGIADLVPVTDLRPLREKALRGNGFSGWGYGDAETRALGEALGSRGEGWKVTVVQR